MPRYFLDSSALVKRYHQESGSAQVEGLFNELGNRFFVSRLALVELHSCFARLVREGILPEANFHQLVARLELDVASGILTVAAVSNPRLQAASAILGTHGLTSPARTLDVIHLATAQALHFRTRIAALLPPISGFWPVLSLLVAWRYLT